MASGLFALLDDVAVIARAAAASVDDVAAGIAKAGTKAAGVVIDDAAVTPSYVTDFTPDRELPVIWAIAKGSLFNKLVVLLPIALLLSEFLPAAITPLLMLGGAYLSFEGAEKVLEKLGLASHAEASEDKPTDASVFEKSQISGAIRTDLILSAEIMAISLSTVADQSLFARGFILALVGVLITVAVYGTVAFIVKMDDIGLHLVKKPSAFAQKTGRGLLHAMPILLTVLASVGTVAMLWVGGGIILHGLDELGLPMLSEIAHDAQHAVAHATGAAGGVLGWLTYAVLSAVVGLKLGVVLAIAMQIIGKVRGKAAH